MKRIQTWAVAVIAAAVLTTPALGSIVVIQGSSAPTYGTTLNFDEPGGPTGNTASSAWLGTHGITDLSPGDGAPNRVDTWQTFYGPWVGTDNSFFGNYGVFAAWADDLTEFSAQVWDPSGTPGPFGGGLGVYVFDDGVQVGSAFVEPAWGGIGDEWIDITTDAGSVFDEVRILGFGFSPTTFVDNLSWNAVPEPSSLVLLIGGMGVTLLRRRR